MYICLDSNVFIYALNGHEGFGAKALTLLKQVERGEIRGIASEFVYLEVLSGRNLGAAEVSTVEGMLAASGVKFMPVNLTVLREAAALRRTYNVTLADAIHLATAAAQGCDYLVTNDHDLLKKSLHDLRILSLEDTYTETLKLSPIS